ncbi:MAG: NfeD family protein [Mycobacteriales bacterium]
MAAWLLWLIAAGVLAIAEALAPLEFVLTMFAGGALAAGIAGAVGAALVIQVVVFAVASIALLALVRPALRRHMLAAAPHTKTGIEGLIGKEAVVLEPVDGRSGRVKIGGDTWSATSYDGATTLDVGSTVKVMEINGATAVVWGDM